MFVLKVSATFVLKFFVYEMHNNASSRVIGLLGSLESALKLRAY